MKILLDTNIIIHRETHNVVNQDIGVLFKWIDNLHYTKCIHPVTVDELNKYKDPNTRRTINIKLENYNLLRTQAPMHVTVAEVSSQVDKNENDVNDSKLLNELINDRVDILITEDRKIHRKAKLLSVADRVYTVDSFLERAVAEHPDLVDYKVLPINKELFGNIDLRDEFFDSLKEDYPGFVKWFNKKADETAYICKSEDKLLAFLYLKHETEDENYSDIQPAFAKKRRLKIGTFKVVLNGFKLGERFLKIIVDNALRFKVDEIYVTIFDKRLEQQRLINLLREFGFKLFGYKTGPNPELVLVRDFCKTADLDSPKLTFPYFSQDSNHFLVPIRPEYHTDLLPDSILRTESPEEYVEHEPYRHAISKVYVTRSIERNLRTGDVIVFYRTGGYYKSVVTTVGVVESAVTNITDATHFIGLCKKRSVFSDEELSRIWNENPRFRPFVLNFLYCYSFPKRLNMQRLIEIGVIPGVNAAPRGITKISREKFLSILKEAKVDESIVVD